MLKQDTIATTIELSADSLNRLEKFSAGQRIAGRKVTKKMIFQYLLDAAVTDEHTFSALLRKIEDDLSRE